MLAGLNEDLALPLLLPRPTVSDSGPFYSSVQGKRVLVTGAGGSIGSELVLQIAGSEPAHLVMADISELNLYEIDSTIRQGAPDQSKLAAILDVRDVEALQQLMVRESIDIVFHAAALKHVPLLENDHNLIEAVLTNFLGTLNVARTVHDLGAEMVLVSTDKAVNPSSTMGQTKRLAELYVRATAQVHGSSCYSQVRFGNVIGSSGSVVPLFRRQIAQGGPVTVTHQDMTRYMMSIKEAVGLVLDASSLQHDEGDGYGLYILDMGEPVKIIDLARQLIQLSGHKPGRDIKIDIVGMRPGEKLHEELTYPWEELHETPIKGVQKAGVSIDDPAMLLHRLNNLAQIAMTRDPAATRTRMQEIIALAVANNW